MPPIQFLIKPASGSCNLRCSYCFYGGASPPDPGRACGMMPTAVLEALVRKGIEAAEGSCSFLFQGGEPTLAGLDFYRGLFALEARYRREGVRVEHALQTNGILLDGEWARFLREKQFLVGLSLDGPPDLHNAFRRDARGAPTHAAVMRAAALLRKAGVPFQILCVVTGLAAEKTPALYGFMKRNGFRGVQFIPCVEPARGGYAPGEALSPALYGQFLCTLFDLWYRDLLRGTYLHIRYFDNLIGILCGGRPELCELQGGCMNQLVVEADGSVYPCDFYVREEWKLGSILTDALPGLQECGLGAAFVQSSLRRDPACSACQWAALCGGGCRRDCPPGEDGALGRNRFCESYRLFFAHAAPRLQALAAQIRQRQGGAR